MSVGIRYTSAKEDTAMSVKDKLEEFGYDVNCVDRGKVTHSQIIAHEKTVSSELISKLKRKIPEIKRMQFVYEQIVITARKATLQLLFRNSFKFLCGFLILH